MSEENTSSPFFGGDESSSPIAEMEQSINLEEALNDKALDEAQSQGQEQEEEVVEVEEKIEKEDQFSKKFAALSRKEKAIRDRELELENRFKSYEAKLLELEEKNKPAPEPEEESIESLMKRNPLKALERYGWDYKKLTESQLNDGEIPQDMQMKIMRDELENKYEKQIEEIRNELIEDKKDRENKVYDKQIETFVSELTDFVNTNSEKYEMIAANDSVDLVFNVIEDHFKDTGRILSNEEASDEVEAYLEEEARKLLKLKKLQVGRQEQSNLKEPSLEKRQSPTLSNAHSAQVTPKADSKLSKEESLQNAASLLKWHT